MNITKEMEEAFKNEFVETKFSAYTLRTFNRCVSVAREVAEAQMANSTDADEKKFYADVLADIALAKSDLISCVIGGLTKSLNAKEATPSVDGPPKGAKLN